MVKKIKYECGCATNIGNSRKVNQDAVICKSAVIDGKSFCIMAVCDGVGGLEHSELASLYLIEKMREWFDEIIQWKEFTDSPELVFSNLKDAAESWNEGICQLALSNNIKTGSTMSVFLAMSDTYYILHVGDSRIYRFDGGLKQITADQTVTKYKAGVLRNYLGNYMGKSEELWFEISNGRIREGDIFLCCSDGFYHYFTMRDAIDISRSIKKSNISALCDEFIHIMMSRGEKDNISLALLSVNRKRWLGLNDAF